MRLIKAAFPVATVTVTVNGVNNATSVALTNTVTSLQEDRDTAKQVKVADIVVSDVDAGAKTLALNGAQADSFEIVGTELFFGRAWWSTL